MASETQQVTEGELEQLRVISRKVFGDRMEILAVDPKLLKYAPKNARYFQQHVFGQLVSNIQRDGLLASVPLCWRDPEGALWIVSGNNRIKAAIAAGVKLVVVLVWLEELSRGEFVSRQLSHNALVGEDDQNILGELWREVAHLEDRLYAGLDSKLIAELSDSSYKALGPPRVAYEHVALWFLPTEVAKLESLLEQCLEVFLSRKIYLSHIGDFERLFKAIVAIKQSKDIVNTSTAFSVLLDYAEMALRAEKEAHAEAGIQRDSATVQDA